MDRRHIRSKSQEEPKSNVAPLPMLPPRVPSTANQQVPHGQGQRVDSNAEMDSKKLRRVAASREYSQRYRLKQMQYIATLEDGVRKLEAEMAINIPRVQYIRVRNSLVRAENNSLKERLSSFTQELGMKQAEYEELRMEKEVLKHLYLMQQQAAAFGQSTTQPMHYDNQMMMNVGMNQPGFNQFVAGAAAAPPPTNPMMQQNQDIGNEFRYGVNNGGGHNPM